MTAQDEIPHGGGQPPREDGQHEQDGNLRAGLSGPSDEGATVPETQVRVDDLSEIAHKPDD